MNGETAPELIFEYKQNGIILTSEYKGGAIISGHLIGWVDSDGTIEMSYHQINLKGEIKTGICHSETLCKKITLFVILTYCHPEPVCL